MSRTSRIQVVVVDDHPVVRFGLAGLIKLQGDMALVGDVGSGEEACTQCEQGASTSSSWTCGSPG